MRERSLYILFILIGVTLFGLELIFGSVRIPLNDVLNILFSNSQENESWTIIVRETRLPRAIAALVAGAFLSLSGLFMQTLFRNPLAGPHILGVSAGSSLGVAIVVLGIEGVAISVGMATDLFVMMASFIGAMAVLAILFIISLRVKDVLTVLIFGVLLGAISMAFVGVLQYLSSDSQLKAFLIWTLGSFDGVEISEARIMLLSGIPLLLLTLMLLKSMNLMLIGEEYALSLGMNVKRTRLLIMMLAGSMTAIITSYCGPIGFVGVVVPHFSRLIFKTFDHRKLVIASVLIGINLMLFADLISHLPGSEHILPINSITSLIGIPFIFWILLRKKTITAI